MYFVHIPKTGGTSITNALYISGHLTQFTGHHRSRHIRLCDVPTLTTGTPIVTCIRNPHDRLVSIYNYFIRYKRRENITFREFVMKYETDYHGSCTMDTQCSYITVDGKVAATDILRFEHLETDWAKLCAKYDMECSLDHLRSHHVPRPEYDTDMKQVVERVFADDIALWKNLSDPNEFLS